MNRTSDVCKYLKHKKGVHFVLIIVYDILSKHGRFAQKCPMRKILFQKFSNGGEHGAILSSYDGKL